LILPQTAPAASAIGRTGRNGESRQERADSFGEVGILGNGDKVEVIGNVRPMNNLPTSDG
jgi:hypothetical protein